MTMSPRLEEYVRLRDSGYHAMMRGDLDRAKRDFEDALGAAAGCLDEDPDAVEKAEVNLAMIRVQCHEDQLAEKGLREVLLRSLNDDVIRMAAHCLAKILSHRNDHEKALRFARLALEKSRGMADSLPASEVSLRMHSSLGLIAAVYGNQSYLEDSLSHYEQALAVLEENPLAEAAHHAFYWSAYQDAIGYTLVLLGRLQEGRLRLEAAHERTRAFGITDLVAEVAADLCFCHLQLGRLEQARIYGEAALEIAEAQRLDRLRRNCYYLLGEIGSREGDEEAAETWFGKLGQLYPQVPFLGEFLRQYDISSMINLKEFA